MAKSYCRHGQTPIEISAGEVRLCSRKAMSGACQVLGVCTPAIPHKYVPPKPRMKKAHNTQPHYGFDVEIQARALSQPSCTDPIFPDLPDEPWKIPLSINAQNIAATTMRPTLTVPSVEGASGGIEPLSDPGYFRGTMGGELGPQPFLGPNSVNFRKKL